MSWGDGTDELLLWRRKKTSVLAASVVASSKVALDLISDLGITIATGVSAWSDQGPRGNHVVQAATGQQPPLVAAVLNGHPALRPDLSDDNLERAGTFTGITAAQTVYVYTICNDRVGTGNYRGCLYDFSLDGGANHGLSLFHYDTNLWGRHSNASGGTNNMLVTDATVGPRLYTQRIDTGQIALDINNTQVFTSGITDGMLTTPTFLKIGNIYGGGIGNGNFDIFRIIALSPKPTAPEHAAILAILKSQYPSIAIA
jgi:hypothetical protein